MAGGVFCKTVSARRHFLRTPPAICLGAQSLQDAEAAGAQRVDILDTDTGRTYRASIATCRRYGRPLDRGHGAQLAIPLGQWALDDPASPYRQLAFDM